MLSLVCSASLSSLWKYRTFGLSRCVRRWDLGGCAVGPRPAYGLFLRNCEGVAVDGLELRWESAKRTERRPAFVIENASEISLLKVSFPPNWSRYLACHATRTAIR